MPINQHNYEEFFLLYADGELSAADKEAVEQFVQANPGLADELEILQQMKLPDDEVAFDDKDILYRNASNGIGAENYEENFLLYMDDELPSAAKQQVETFVLQHPALQQEFTLLKQLRLEPETILFPDKQSLYRKEEKERPVFYLAWQRIAVAAALVGLIVLVWTMFPGNHSTAEKNIARQQPEARTSTRPKNAGMEQKDAANNLTLSGQASTNTLALTTAAGPLPAIQKKAAQPKNSIAESIQTDSGNLVARNDLQLPADPSKKEITVTQKTDQPQSISPVQIPTAEKNPLAGTDITEPKNNMDLTLTANNNIIEQNAVYKKLDTEDEKKSLYLGSIEINKDKFRGFFRKAGSLLRGKARQQEDDKPAAGLSNTRSLK